MHSVLFSADSVSPDRATTLQSAHKTLARRFAVLAWFALGFNLLVIALGTLVRATGSGDGCGSHWPTCNGETIPVSASVHTLIEFTHRISTALDGVLTLVLVGMGIAAYRKSEHRRYIIAPLVALLLMLAVEALVGRHLVVRGLVTTNATQERAVWMAVHLVTTFLLLTSLAMAAWWGSNRPTLRLRGQGIVGAMLGFAALGTLILGISGAITALGDTVFPVTNHTDVLHMSLDPRAHFLIRLRILHPFIAMGMALYLILVGGLLNHLRPSALTKQGIWAVGGVLVLEMALGYLNVLLRAPVWMQLVHLLTADLLWLSVTFLSFGALAVGIEQTEQVESTASDKATWRDYLDLTKPRVISLLLATTAAAMYIAADHARPVSWQLLIAVMLGGYMSAGAAKVFNMVLDRDLDLLMKRTANRATATAKISPTNALIFAWVLTVGSVALLWNAANALAALLSFAGLVFYVVIYTMLLKRRSWHNIVIGGAAGAFPPLVGWAAVTDGLSPLAWYLFAIVFLWTPAHFWALALLLKDDYAEAGVPMLPVVRGERNTVIQIGIYAILTAIISILPLWNGLVGYGYVVAAVVLNLVFLGLSLRLWRHRERKEASQLFHYSMLYLALLFAAMAVDHSLARL